MEIKIMNKAGIETEISDIQQITVDQRCLKTYRIRACGGLQISKKSETGEPMTIQVIDDFIVLR